jgi:Hemerythrin HHE cation binding domain
MSDAIHLLKTQHAAVTALFMQIERATDPRLRAQIFRTIDSQLRVHGAIEEKIFYPAFRERARSRMQADEVSEALQEHDQVKAFLAQLERTDPADERFKTHLASLKLRVQEHVYEEEHGMLKQARRLFSEEELEALGFRMEQTASLTSPVYEMAGIA